MMGSILLSDLLPDTGSFVNYSSIVQHQCNATANTLTDKTGFFKSELLNVVTLCSTNVTLEILLSVSKQ